MRRLSYLVGSLLAILLPSLALAQPAGTDCGPGMMWGGGWPLMMVFGPLMMILFGGTIILLVVLAVRWLGGSSESLYRSPRGAALEILQERLARGEIEKEEYEEKKDLLTS